MTLKSSLQAGEVMCNLNKIARCTEACRCKTNVALPIKRPIKIVLSQQMARCIANTTFTSIQYYQNSTSCHRFEVSYQLPPKIHVKPHIYSVLLTPQTKLQAPPN